MNNDKPNKPLSEEENFEELLKNFMPKNDRNDAGTPTAKTGGDTKRTAPKQGIYFSQSKNIASESTDVRKTAAGQASTVSDGTKHILIPAEKDNPSATVHQSYKQQPFNNQSEQGVLRSNQTVSFPAQSVRTTASGTATSRREPAANAAATKTEANTARQSRTSSPSERKTSNTSSRPINKSNGRKKKKQASSSQYNTMVRVVICLASVALIIAASALIKAPIMGCVNDIIAIDGTDDEVSVTVTEGMSTREIINMLGDKGLINNSMFCNIVSDFLGYDKDTEYPAGTYTLTSEMGVEGMLAEIVAAGKDTQTVTLTFPEGYTVEQIIARLASNGVASTGSLYAAISDYEFTGIFEHLNGIRDSATRFSALEGYLYPDTYDFYVGENPNSVIRKFLLNFEDKWTQVYSDRAEELGYTLDEILTVASIIEKEAYDAQQMPIVASVLYNRLGASSLYPHLECDSTMDYVEKLYDDSKINNAEYYSLLMLYDSYQVTGLPEGPICNPGGDALEAALYPDSTLYYYFMHDKQGNIYLASTADEHAANAVAAGIQ